MVAILPNVSHSIKLAYPNIEGFSDRNLKRMKRFYKEYKDDEKMPQLVAHLPWGHNVLLFEKIKDIETRLKYIEGCIQNGWSRSVLLFQIETKYHLILGNSVNNFKDTLPPIDSDLVNNTLKDPYIFVFLSLNQNYKEKELENNMLLKIKNVLLELGNVFSFIGSQYKITAGDKDYYIDLLFYHLKLKSYIAVI